MGKPSSNETAAANSEAAGTTTSSATSETGNATAGATASGKTAAAPVAKAGGVKFFAQRNILHGSKVIVRGSEIPADFPADSLDLLGKGGDIATTPPPTRK